MRQRSVDDRYQVSPRDPNDARDRDEADRRVQGRKPAPATGPRIGPRVGPRVGRISITPTRVILPIAVVGSVLFAVYTLTVRDPTQIPLLAAGMAVLGIVFGTLTVIGVISTYQAGSDERTMRAMLLAIGSGVASIIALGCFAGAVLLAMVWTAGRR
jgi:hypothetical protein